MTDITLDKPRRLLFDLTAILDLERATGHPTGHVLANLRALSMTTLIAALWAGLKHDEPLLQMQTVQKRLAAYLEAGGMLEPLFGQLTDALDNSGVFRTEDPPPPDPVATVN